MFRRLPVLVSAPLVGFAVLVAGAVPWSYLAGWNLRVFPVVPWSILPMAVYLWLYWKYLDGAGWPRSTAEARRSGFRANALSGDVWGLSILAGLIGLSALLPLLGIMARLMKMPAESLPITAPPDMPFVTLFLALVMASIVAGVTEEAAFRGFMQGPIERRHGFFVAILVSGAVFGLGHFRHHPTAVLALLPYYIAVSAVYGGLAYLTNSILPGLVLHAGGDVFSLTRLWTTGRPEWQITSAPPRLVWETGVDAAFLQVIVAFILLGGGAVWAYASLARAIRDSPHTPIASI